MFRRISKGGEALISISVIVPIYKGEKYIPNIYKMVSENYTTLNQTNKSKIELIFVNDCPQEPVKFVESTKSKDFVMKILQTDINRGIHGARSYGLQFASGEYILFLDQDDEIKPYYLLSQINILRQGEYDAVVSNGMINNYKKIYATYQEQIEILSMEQYWNKGNRIISPGQVLLKRASIPTEWGKNILENNGADDYFLWMLMLKKKRQFVANTRVLYYHNPSRTDSSVTAECMQRSFIEVIELLTSLHIITPEEKIYIFEQYRKRIEVNNDIRNSSRIRLSELYLFTKKWLKNKILNYSMLPFFYKLDYRKIAIYGAADLGEYLYEELRNTDIEVVCFIDKTVEMLWNNDMVAIFKPTDSLPPIDAIIVTSIYHIDEIKENYKERVECPIHSLREVIDQMKKLD